MTGGVIRFLAICLAAALLAVPSSLAGAQEFGDSAPDLHLPDITGYAPRANSEPLALGGGAASEAVEEHERLARAILLVGHLDAVEGHGADGCVLRGGRDGWQRQRG